MTAKFARSAARLFRHRRVSTLGFLLTLMASSSAGAQQGTLPAPAEVELEFGLRGGIPAAVSLERFVSRRQFLRQHPIQ